MTWRALCARPFLADVVDSATAAAAAAATSVAAAAAAADGI
jgi:hypothetical protein